MVTIKRTAAIGDILMVMPLVQALRQKYGAVSLQVAPSLHSKIRQLIGGKALELVAEKQSILDEELNLDGAYEMRPYLHPVEAYCEVAGVAPADTTQGFCNTHYDLRDGKFDVVIHATVSWPNRTLPRAFWADLVTALKADGLTVACVAHSVAEIVPNCDAVFLGKPLPYIAGLIEYGAGVFICGDSGPLHIAACTQTPIVGLFTIALAERRRPWGRPASSFVGINAAVDCIGCLHRAPQPCSFLDCDFQDERKHACLNGFSIAEIVGHVKGFL